MHYPIKKAGSLFPLLIKTPQTPLLQKRIDTWTT